METILEHQAQAETRAGHESGALAAPEASGACSGPSGVLLSATHVVERLSFLCRESVRAGGLMSVGQAAEFAAEVEAMSRSVDYLQIVCAGALETHRVAEACGSFSASGTQSDAHKSDWNNTWAEADSPLQGSAGKVHAEFRSTADYLRCRLRISRGEARRRLKLASALLPAGGGVGQSVPPPLPVLAGAAAAGKVSSVAALIIAESVERVRQRSGPETAEAMETDLALIGGRHDTDFLARAAQRWVLLADQDGAEPSEEELRRFQGVFSGRKKNGLNHLSIYCTAEQHETLLTVMNAAAGPRVPIPAEAATPERADGSPPDEDISSRLDRRTRAQRLLGGLIDAAKAALAGGGVPASGGLRPQIMVTIDAVSLLKDFDYGSVVKDLNSERTRIAGKSNLTGNGGPERANPGSFAFTGPVPAATVRKLACDAEMLPVVLSGEGRILDVGRAQRLFPAHLRKALHARDGGCAFPGCSIPGPWTEAHHIHHWNRGGTTSTDNGVLLCSHHHHEVHKENWRISVRSGVPWFVPPPYVDPDRTPLRNRYFHLSAGHPDATRSAS